MRIYVRLMEKIKFYMHASRKKLGLYARDPLGWRMELRQWKRYIKRQRCDRPYRSHRVLELILVNDAYSAVIRLQLETEYGPPQRCPL